MEPVTLLPRRFQYPKNIEDALISGFLTTAQAADLHMSTIDIAIACLDFAVLEKYPADARARLSYREILTLCNLTGQPLPGPESDPKLHGIMFHMLGTKIRRGEEATGKGAANSNSAEYLENSGATQEPPSPSHQP